MKFSRVLFGPAGSAGLGNEEGIRYAAELKLGAYEIEFTYGVRMSNAEAKKVGEIAKKLSIKLSVHGPYYVNLASKEKAKLNASKKRILLSCERAHYMGASPVVFHAGFYQGRTKEEVYKIIKEQIIDLQKTIKAKKWNVKIAPETTGKKSQFAGLNTLLKLKKETGCHLCVDFAHLYARNVGKMYYDEIFKKIKSLPHIHCHFSGITYTQKGERSHISLTKQFFMPLAKAIKKYKPKSMVIINESPRIFEDAVNMQKWLK
ncbi:TIM barrel protein [Candidatus Woesearchaeota archaeon]|nr:TIM barrel protein [Candidatus Woesearchaeota archaeon]